jgi:hypothetical protein
MTFTPELVVYQTGRFTWVANIRNKTMVAPYIQIDVSATSKDRAVNKALRKFHRVMARHERLEASREIRSIPR